MSDLRKALEDKAIEIFFPKRDKLTPPKNRVWVAVIVATLIFGFLDILTMISVSVATRWYYGVLILIAGIGTLIPHEWLFVNPFAGLWQRVISVFGFFTSVVTTGLIGILAIVLSLVGHGYNVEYLGAGMVAFSFATLFIHASLFIIYFFIDQSILDKQKATQSLANHQSNVLRLDMEEAVVTKLNEFEAKLDSIVKRGDGKKFSAVHEEISGEKLELPNE